MPTFKKQLDEEGEEFFIADDDLTHEIIEMIWGQAIQYLADWNPEKIGSEAYYECLFMVASLFDRDVEDVSTAVREANGQVAVQ